jgi:hypothetical protein
MRQIYYGEFEGNWRDKSGLEAMAAEFEEPLSRFDGCEILFAAYTYEDYSGDTFVLFAKDGELYEVTGSHCSCHGLEGQFEPEKVVAEELLNRIETSSYGVTFQLKEEIVEAVKGYYPETYGDEQFSLWEFFHEC